MVRGPLAARIRNPASKGGPKGADYVLYARPNLPIAVIEAKQARFSVGHGMQQALTYAEMLDAPFAISSNGDGFLLHDRTGLTNPTASISASSGVRCLASLTPLDGFTQVTNAEGAGEGSRIDEPVCRTVAGGPLVPAGTE